MSSGSQPIVRASTPARAHRRGQAGRRHRARQGPRPLGHEPVRHRPPSEDGPGNRQIRPPPLVSVSISVALTTEFDTETSHRFDSSAVWKRSA